MPQPCMTSRPWRSLKPAIIARGAAEPPTSMPRIAERSHLPGFASSSARMPSQIVGTPAAIVTRFLHEVLEQRSRDRGAARGTRASRRSSSRGTGSPTRSRGTSARPAGSRRCSEMPRPIGFARGDAERVQHRRAVRVEDALRHPGRAARVTHRRRLVLVELRVAPRVGIDAGEQLLVRRPRRRTRARCSCGP